MLRFFSPEWFWLLVLLPVLLVWRGRSGSAASVRYSNVFLAQKVARQTRSRIGDWRWLWPYLAAILLVCSLARPQVGEGRTETTTGGIDIVLALDISGSMAAMDFNENGVPRNRIDIVKNIVGQFIDARPNDRISVLAFAGAPYVISPLTLDHDWLLQNLERVSLGTVEDGTAIGSAIAAGTNRLRESSTKSKVMILLTDGENNSGAISPLVAAEAAKALGVKIYTIGVGINGEAPTPVKDNFGNTHMVMQKVDVDEVTLQKIADVTGGRFYRATDTDSLIRVYGEINQLEKTMFTVKRFEHYHELFAWLVIPALGLVIGAVALESTRYRRLP